MATSSVVEPWWDRLRPKSSIPPSWREQVLPKRYYAASCFTYSALGALVWHFRVELGPTLPSLLPWPWVAVILALQGPFSFMADVYSLARPSWWHLGDAAMASILVAFYVQLMLFGLPHGSIKGSLQPACRRRSFWGSLLFPGAVMQPQGKRPRDQRGFPASARRRWTLAVPLTLLPLQGWMPQLVRVWPSPEQRRRRRPWSALYQGRPFSPGQAGSSVKSPGECHLALWSVWLTEDSAARRPFRHMCGRC